MTQREESDQLPEEGPGGQATDDDNTGDRDDAQKNAGATDKDDDDEKGQSTGNPANAG
jgi:hypothetical protein